MEVFSVNRNRMYALLLAALFLFAIAGPGTGSIGRSSDHGAALVPTRGIGARFTLPVQQLPHCGQA